MISCQKCAHDNPIGTVFCRGCGVRLEVNLQDIERSIIGSRKADLDDHVFRWGRSSFALCGFLLVCALVLRHVVAPPMPPSDWPDAPLLPLIPKDPPAWAVNAIPNTSSLAGGAALNGPVDFNGRLAWRRDHAAALLTGLGIERAKLVALQQAVAATVGADGTVAGDDPLAATALAALALQACPGDEGVDAAIVRCHGLLTRRVGELVTAKEPLARTLGALALLDAELLPAGERAKLNVYLVDGKAAFWQAWMLPLYPADDRPTQLAALRAELKGPAWDSWFELVAGGVARPDPVRLGSAAANALASGEERLVWAAAAWARPALPLDLAHTLAAWCGQPAAPVAVALTQKCGPQAATAVAVLTVAAPLRLTPLALAR
jgi:hypothetical protein